MSRRTKSRREVSTSGTAGNEGDRPQPMSIDAQLVPDTIHDWLRFNRRLMKYNKFCENYNLLKDKEFEPLRTVDWSPLEQAGVDGEIKNLIAQNFEVDDVLYEYKDWENLFQIRENIYRELCIEFHCTFELNENMESATDATFMTFRLGGEWRQMSIVDLARSLGIYSEEETEADHFEDYMWDSDFIQPDFLPKNIWHEFSEKPFRRGGNSYKDLTDKRLRVIQRCLCGTVSQRRENAERVNFIDLWILREFKQEFNINIPHVVAWYLLHHGSGIQEGTPICGGHYITRIAKSFGISFDGLQRVAGKYTIIGFPHFKGCEIVAKTSTGYQAILEEESESQEEEEGGQEQPESPPPRRRMKHPNVVEGEETAAHFQGGFAGYSPQRDSAAPGPSGTYDFQAMMQSLQSFQDESRYMMGRMEYSSDWRDHNQDLFYANPTDFRPTPRQHIPHWGAPDAVIPPPVYDPAAALAEAQRLHQEQYQQQHQQQNPNQHHPGGPFSGWF